MRCPHLIDLDAAVEPPDWVDHPTAAFFMPVPRSPGEKPRYLYDPTNQYEAQILALTRLSSPTMFVVRPIWTIPARLDRTYQVTNLGVEVRAGIELNHIDQITTSTVVAEAANRRILFISRERLPLFGQVDKLEMESLPSLLNEPMEAIGAAVLRRHMS
jgi:hypothetical protein